MTQAVDTSLQIGEIGEIFNISMSSASNAVAEILDKDVEISTINVEMQLCKNTDFKQFEPSIFSEYEFTNGLKGKSLLVFTKQSIKDIVSILLQKNFFNEEFILEEINESAAREVLDQMMAACYSALANFAGNEISASTQRLIESVDTDSVKFACFDESSNLVVIKFKLEIAEVTKSEFLLILNESQAKELLINFNTRIPNNTNEVIENEVLPQNELFDENIQVDDEFGIRPARLPVFEDTQVHSHSEQEANLKMVMSVQLDIKVEIGDTSKQIQEILQLKPGSVLRLNNQAGSQVSIFANGQLIAGGDVVIVDDYYSVRVADIINNSDIIKIL
ncbi:MAG: FliM/FliN family flagellar motor switch protein [Oscillospiraceae bacterium]